LSQVTGEIMKALRVRATLVPMSDDLVRTRICTSKGELEFQTYFVKRRARGRVTGLRFYGAGGAAPGPGILDAFGQGETIIMCPSNPFISIGPILAIPGIRDALRARRAAVAAISPIVGGQAIKGPAAAMMKSMKMRPAAAEVARLYTDFVGTFVLDEVDRRQAAAVKALGMRPVVMNTIMSDRRARKDLAGAVIRALRTPE